MELSPQDLLKARIVIPAQVPAITFAHTLAGITVMVIRALAGIVLGRR